jgi:serine/threonine protein phosphatase PrpC
MRILHTQSSRLGNRKINQDRSIVVTRDFATLLVLADGMGGHAGGELAAQTVVDYFEQQFNQLKQLPDSPRDWLKVTAFGSHQATQGINTESVRSPRTTCVACMIHGKYATWLHAGDSRLYLIRNNHVYIRTRDHTYVEDLVQNKAITEQEVTSHPMRNYVTSCFGGQTQMPFISVSQAQALKEKDILLLCSDGLWGALKEEQILETLTSHGLEKAIDSLTEQAEKESYPHCDNTTIAAAQILRVAHKEKPEQSAIDDLDDAQDELQSAISSIERAYRDYANEFDEFDDAEAAEKKSKPD